MINFTKCKKLIGEGRGSKNRALGNYHWMGLNKWTEKNYAHTSSTATFILNYVIYYKLNNTVNAFLYAPKDERNGVAFFFKLSLFPWLISPSLKWFEQMQLLGYTLESPNLKRSSHAQFFGILKKLTFLQEELFWHFFTMQYLDMLVLK